MSWITLGTYQHSHAYRYRDGAMEDLGSLSGPSGTSGGAAINVSGVVTGFSYTATHDEVAFSYSSGPMQALPSRQAFNMGLGVNARQVVGQFSPVNGGPNHALLITGGHAFDLNTLIPSADAATYTLTDAPGINDRGQIVANGSHREPREPASLSHVSTDSDSDPMRAAANVHVATPASTVRQVRRFLSVSSRADRGGTRRRVDLRGNSLTGLAGLRSRLLCRAGNRLFISRAACFLTTIARGALTPPIETLCYPISRANGGLKDNISKILFQPE